MTLNCRSGTCAYLIARGSEGGGREEALELERQFRVNKALLYVDAVYN
jgi:hypothetical protein